MDDISKPTFVYDDVFEMEIREMEEKSVSFYQI
jgi:hypothetical protein